jgi:hypothetical protein
MITAASMPPLPDEPSILQDEPSILQDEPSIL